MIFFQDFLFLLNIHKNLQLAKRYEIWYHIDMTKLGRQFHSHFALSLILCDDIAKYTHRILF